MRLKWKQPELAARQQTEITRMQATCEYAIADLKEAFSDARPVAQQPGDRQRDSDRGEVEQTTVRGQRRCRLHMNESLRSQA
jgi:hypothetical protein